MTMSDDENDTPVEPTDSAAPADAEPEAVEAAPANPAVPRAFETEDIAASEGPEHRRRGR